MAEGKATLNFDVSKDLYDQIEAESNRLQISKADLIRMRLVESFVADKNSTATVNPEK